MFFNNVKILFKGLAVEEHYNVNVTNVFTNAVTILYDNGSAVIYPMDNITKVEIYPMR